MFVDFLIAFAAAVFVGVAPGYFLSLCLIPATSHIERVVYSTALSVTLSPAIALGLARLLGSGVSLWMAVAAPVILACAGLVAYLVVGPTKEKGVEPIPRVPSLPPPVFLPLAGACLLMLGAAFGAVSLLWTAPPTALLVILAGALHLRGVHREEEPAEAAPEDEPSALARLVDRRLVRRVALAAVLGVALLRGYVGPSLYDWPFIRGVDHYSHAVMANLMMERGQIDPYLIYPPGFHTLTAMVSRISTLDPLEIFAVLGPALLLLPPLALYVLGRRLWGTWAGIIAALLSTVVGGTYSYFEDAMYPNLVTSQFLLVITIAALVGFYKTPTARAGAFLVLVGSSVTLFHPVASLYLALLLGLVGACLMPYLLLRWRSAGLALIGALAALGVLAALYAQDTYDLIHAVAGRLGIGDAAKSTTGDAVGMALGTQWPYMYDIFIGYILSQPVAWLGLLGLFLLVGVRDRADFSGASLSGKMARLTIMLWTLLLLVGSCTPMSGFPQRFGRDLGVPLSLLAAFAVLALLRSVGPLLFERTRAKPVIVFAASLTALSLGMLMSLQMYTSLEDATGPSEQLTITPAIGEAGEWLKEHNEGGNIMVSPHGNQVPSRMMLAMGDYFEYQSFENYQIRNPRDLPPTSTAPLWDVFFVTHNPGHPRTQKLLEERDVRYVVLYKNMPDRPTAGLWVPFKAHPDRYSIAFENDDVLIVETRL